MFSVKSPLTAHVISDRERQVLALVTRGLTNKEIAGLLGIATATVNQHLHNLLLKLASSNRTQLAVTAVRMGLVGSSSPGGRQTARLTSSLPGARAVTGGPIIIRG